MVSRCRCGDKKGGGEPNDAFLLGGFPIAVWVVSSRQLGTLLDRAREIDHGRGLQLVPALVILTVVFLVHQIRKREEIGQEASVATMRAAEMDRLVQFGKALAQSLDSGSIRAATVEHLPLIASGRTVWADRTMRRRVDRVDTDRAGCARSR